MKPWTRSSRCLLCQFRAAPNQDTLSSTRQYHASSTLYSDKSLRRPARRRDTVTDRVFRPLNAIRSPKDTVPSPERRSDLFRERHEQGIDTSRKRRDILKALRKVRAWLQNTPMSKASDVSQMKGLDPDNIYWPAFEALTKEVVEKFTSTQRGTGYIANLMRLPSDQMTREAESAIQYAFLDYVLDLEEAAAGTNSNRLSVQYPTEWYPKARQIQRNIHLHVGPTNSGKTYTALKRLEQAQNGFYAGPLRLLAHEVYSRFNDRGVKCDLVTGDDVRLSETDDVQLYASTVEMVDTGRALDVGVIDEIQMIGDMDRGWAWTRAVLGARVKELHLCGETRVVPMIRAIVASMGDTLHIHQYERLSPLKVMSTSLKGNLQNLRKGDCIVSFSIMNIHALKRQIEIDTGKRCAIIYGGLPPETRAQQAALFNDPDNDYDYLAASDAIGMGLNLSIKRIVFETTMKFNGTFREQLSVPQIKQIAGRAGRYRTAQDDKKPAQPVQASPTSNTRPRKPQTIGLVTCLDERDLPAIQKALSTEGAPLKAAGILPPGELYEDLAARLPENTPFEYLLRRMSDTVATHERFQLCDITDQLRAARVISSVQDLSVSSRLLICAAPVGFHGTSRQTAEKALAAMASAIASETPTTIVDIQEIPLETLDEPMSADRTYLESLEALHKVLILYLWLSYRFPRTLRDQDMAIRAKELCEEKINITLLKFSANPKLRERLAGIRKSSEMLSEQLRANGLIVESGLIMNPDQTVEEIDSSLGRNVTGAGVIGADGGLNAGSNEEVAGLEDKIEVVGELDVGDGGQEVEEIQVHHGDVSGEAVNEVVKDVLGTVGVVDSTEPNNDVQEPQRMGGSGSR